MINQLLERGVRIPAPNAVVLEDIVPERIAPGAVIYPGSILRGQKTWIGRDSVIGEGGGALIENVQIGKNARVMQGVYRDCTLLDRVIVRNGAEIREGTLLEEGAELGHTVGLKQTIFFPNVVAGSLINFCDALITGGTSRKVHSEIGSCMALYNFTPQGDKFASRFGDVEHGVLLNRKPIFVGGQTQIVSPVLVEFGAVIAAGSKLTKDVPPDTLFSSPGRDFEVAFDASVIWRPDVKIQKTQGYIQQLELLKLWYQNVRLVVLNGDENRPLMTAAIERIQSGIDERHKRLKSFVQKIPKSFEQHRERQNIREMDAHQKALEIASHPIEIKAPWNFEYIVSTLRRELEKGKSYPEAIAALDEQKCFCAVF